MIQSNEEKSYTLETVATFDEVPSHMLRTYNRLIMMRNVQEDLGEDYAVSYAHQFSKDDVAAMHIMALAIQTVGKAQVLKEVLEDVGEYCPA